MGKNGNGCVCEIVCLPSPTREKGGEKGLYSPQEGCVWDVAVLGRMRWEELEDDSGLDGP